MRRSILYAFSLLALAACNGGNITGNAPAESSAEAGSADWGAAPAGKPTVEKRRFEARVPVGAIDAAQSGAALSQAANQVAQQVPDWVGTQR